jgi:GT2 family glycosyltransferase
LADRLSKGGEADRPAASVIILNHNGLRFLDSCLEAVAAQQVPGGCEVLLVDNGSHDGSIDHVRKAYGWVRILVLGRNTGFSRANNLAMGKARGRHVVLLNNDTRVRDGWLAALVTAADANPRAGAVTSKLVYADRPEVIQNAGVLLLDDGGGGDRGAGEQDRGQYDEPGPVFGFCGAAALLRREMLDDVGCLDETFFAYYEDTDLSWRMRLRGWNVLYEPGAVVEHVHSATSGERSFFFTFHADRNRLFMLFKNASPGFLMRSLRSVLSRVATPQGSKTSVETRYRHPHGRVAASFCLHLPEMLMKRMFIRARRKVTDKEVEGWLYPRAEWDARFV